MINKISKIKQTLKLLALRRWFDNKIKIRADSGPNLNLNRHLEPKKMNFEFKNIKMGLNIHEIK